MKMVLAIVQADDAPKLMEKLVQSGHRVTRVATTGGWLRRENVTLLMGVEDEQIDEVLLILRNGGQHRTAYVSMPMEMTGTVNAQVLEVEVGGATVFVLNVEEFKHY
jgi:uncharacterized protein YaaQ